MRSEGILGDVLTGFVPQRNECRGTSVLVELTVRDFEKFRWRGSFGGKILSQDILPKLVLKVQKAMEDYFVI